MTNETEPGGIESPSFPSYPYRFSCSLLIRYGDIDAQRHLNNAVYLTFMEHTRLSYLRELRLWAGRDFDSLGMILAETTCTYKAPAYLGETVTVWARVSYLGTKSLHFQHRLEAEHREVATGHAVLVAYDYVRQRSIPIPDGWRAAILEYEPGL